MSDETTIQEPVPTLEPEPVADPTPIVADAGAALFRDNHTTPAEKADQHKDLTAQGVDHGN